MATARLMRKQYLMLLESFRQHPGNFTRARQAAGVTHKTAKRAWELGWDKPEWAGPIRPKIEAEQEANRAKIREAEATIALDNSAKRRTKRLAKFDAAEEHLREAQAVRASLGNALSALANVAVLQRASLAASQFAAKKIEEDINSKDPTITWAQAVKLLGAISLATERTARALGESMKTVRLHLGEVQEIVGVQEVGKSQAIVDGEKAVAGLGEKRMKSAVRALMKGEVNEDVEALVRWQNKMASGGGGLH